MNIKILASWKHQHKLNSMSIPIGAQFVLICGILKVKLKIKTTYIVYCLPFACNNFKAWFKRFKTIVYPFYKYHEN